MTTGRLDANRYVVDADPHLAVDADVVRATGCAELLVRVCPAGVFAVAPDGGVTVDHAGCLECAACLAVAPPGAVTWHHPRGGMGIRYREG